MILKREMYKFKKNNDWIFKDIFSTLYWPENVLGNVYSTALKWSKAKITLNQEIYEILKKKKTLVYRKSRHSI